MTVLMISTLMDFFLPIKQRSFVISHLDVLDNKSNVWLQNVHPIKCHVISLGKFENIKYTQRYRIYDK